MQRPASVIAADERAARKVPVALDEVVSHSLDQIPADRPTSADAVVRPVAQR